MPETDKEEKAAAASDLDTGRRLGRRVSNGSVALRKFQPGQRGIPLRRAPCFAGMDLHEYPHHAWSSAAARVASLDPEGQQPEQ